MRRPSITYEAVLAALTLGAATSLVACSKGAAVRSEPTPAASSQTPTPAATTISPPPDPQPRPDPATPSPPPPPQGDGPKPESSATVDAGREHRAPKPLVGGPTKNTRPNATASAACGGSSCSPDMKKGN